MFRPDVPSLSFQLRKAPRLFPAVLALIFVAIFAVDANATTYFVSTSGNDANSCATATSTTQASQKRHISAGVACLSPGDTLYVHAGTYTSGADIIDNTLTTVPAGTDWNAGVITIGAYPGETVTIQPTDGMTAIKLASGSMNGAVGEKYIIFQDLILDGANQTSSAIAGIVFNAGSNHIRVLRVESKNWVGDGIATTDHNSSTYPPSTYFEVIKSIFHNNGRGTGSILFHGMYLDTADNLYDGNSSYHNSGYGLQLYDNASPTARPVSNNIVRNNIFYDNGVGTAGTGGMNNGYGANNQIYNNIIYGNNGSGMLVYSNSSNTTVYNNTIYNNSPYAGINVQYIEGDVIIRNNILYNNAQGGVVDWGGSLGGSIIQDHNLTTNPSFKNPGVVPPDFHLTAASTNAIGAGINLYAAGVTQDFDGHPYPATAPFDIGAYEYNPSGSFSPCDLNQDGSSNVWDVQLAINQALGISTCLPTGQTGSADINQDGKCTVVDVQRVVNAALGGPCVSP